jgi:carbon-monoxide dehydrogenase medium subunit
MSQIADSALLEDRWAALREGAAAVGGPIIRNRASVGGNIVNARPCADTVPPLVALGARVELQGPSGGRIIKLDGFINGPGQTALREGELLTAIHLPPPTAAAAGSAYLKITRRAAMEVTVVGCAASLTLDEKGRRVERARLVYTSVAPIPLRIREAEAILEGDLATDATFRAAAAAARRLVRPSDDNPPPPAYPAEMVELTTLRTLQSSLERALRRSA